MNAAAQMKLIGTIDGINWYWADPDRFEKGGVYYWNGKDNVHVTASSEPGVAAIELHENNWRLGLNFGPVMVLYNDVINDEQVCRDDLWLATTSQLIASTDRPLLASTPAITPEK